MSWNPSPDASSSGSRRAPRQRTVKPESDGEEVEILSCQPARRRAKRQRTIKPEEVNDEYQILEIPPTPVSMQPVDPTPGFAPIENQGYQLAAEQLTAINVMVSGRNTFLTGGAGSGKTAVLLEAVKRLRDLGKRVRVCAPTGMAAYGVGGTTIHSLLGLDPDSAKESLRALENKARFGAVRGRLAATDVLIIDEISMVENFFFERISRMFQIAKGNDKPFGGVQIIVCGDFRQLPPVDPFAYCFTCGGSHGRRTTRDVDNRGVLYVCPYCHNEEEESRQWAFCSQAWDFARFFNIDLMENHRQDEHEFVDFLNRLGQGKGSTRADRELVFDHPCDATRGILVAAKRSQVDKENQKQLGRLGGRAYNYECLDEFDRQPLHHNLADYERRSRDGKTLLTLHSHQYLPKLELKLNMRVILITNIDVEHGLVNGSQGSIVGFKPYNESDLTIERPSIDHTSANMHDRHERVERGSAQIRATAHHVHRLEQMKAFMTEANYGVLLPVVQFDKGQKRTIYPDCNLTQLGDDYPWSLWSRTQIPLVPGYAMTIHKSQGMTMDTLRVDLSGVFASGMAYVALSRASRLSGLKVIGREGLDRHGANVQVTEFLENSEWYREDDRIANEI